MNFFSKLTAAIQQNESLLCVGLDPLEEFLPEGPDLFSRLTSWGTNLIADTVDLVCCYKPNMAFYEQFGPEGLRALVKILDFIPEHIPVLLDAKRGDIGSSADAYARGAYGHFRADAITLSPYLGGDSVRAFLKDPDKAVFILCQTSNPSAKEIQQHGDPPLFEAVARIAQTWGTQDQIGFVIGATQPHALRSVREICPDYWFLAPGVGAQGGDLQRAIQEGLRADGLGLIMPVSRTVMTAPEPKHAAQGLRERINTFRTAFIPEPPPNKQEKLILDLFGQGCVRFGDFILSSGRHSPIYIDLRRIVSTHDLFRQVVSATLGILRTLNYDIVAGVPYAALPLGAVTAWKLSKPLIYPRKEVKAHGTGQNIEGVFQPGQKAVLIDDVITSGGSILTAAETLRKGDLVVEDAVVVVDRKQGGITAMAKHGISVHPALDIFTMIDVLKTCGRIDPATYVEVREYLLSS